MTVWLTHIALDTRQRAVRAELADIVALHKRTMTLLPASLGTSPRNEAGLLFRIEQSRTQTALLIQSLYEPDPARLPSGYGPTHVKKLDPLLESLHAGATVRYRIAASPVKRVWAEHGSYQRGMIEPLEGEQAEQWWIRRATDAGLRLHSLTARPRETAAGKASGVRHTVMQFDGTAIITDVERTRSAIRAGIGKGKSYGCGLLSVVPSPR